MSKQLKTLRDFEEAGVFNLLPNGFDIVSKDGSNITDDYLCYKDKEIIYIGPTPFEDVNVVIAFYLDV